MRQTKQNMVDTFRFVREGKKEYSQQFAHRAIREWQKRKKRGKTSIQSLYFFWRGRSHTAVLYVGGTKKWPSSDQKPITDGEKRRRRPPNNVKNKESPAIVPKSFALLDLRVKIVDARMQSKNILNPEVEGRTHHGWPPKGVSADGDGLGCSGRRNSYLPKDKARTKRRKTSFCFGKAKTDRTPSIEMRDTPGNHQRGKDNWSGGMHKIKILLYGERSPRSTIIFETKYETEKKELECARSSFFLDTKEKKTGRGYKYRTRVVPPKRVPHRREQSISGEEGWERNPNRAPDWVPQKGIYRLTQRENTKYTQFIFVWVRKEKGGEKKKEDNLHIVRGPRAILTLI